MKEIDLRKDKVMCRDNKFNGALLFIDNES